MLLTYFTWDVKSKCMKTLKISWVVEKCLDQLTSCFTLGSKLTNVVSSADSVALQPLHASHLEFHITLPQYIIGQGTEHLKKKKKESCKIFA